MNTKAGLGLVLFFCVAVAVILLRDRPVSRPSSYAADRETDLAIAGFISAELDKRPGEKVCWIGDLDSQTSARIIKAADSDAARDRLERSIVNIVGTSKAENYSLCETSSAMAFLRYPNLPIDQLPADSRGVILKGVDELTNRKGLGLRLTRASTVFRYADGTMYTVFTRLEN